MSEKQTLLISKENIDQHRNTKIEFDGHLEIAADLGIVGFISIAVTGKIVAEAGSGIEAGEGIKAGSGIKAGEGIKAGSGIEAGEGIEAGWGIEAGEGIEAGSGIKAGEGIKAGSGIEAGEGIEAGSGIEAGLAILCKAALSVRFRLFAGLAIWRKTVSDEEKTITCKRFEGGGTVEYGILIETEKTQPEAAQAATATE